jgi:hypothetical protein
MASTVPHAREAGCGNIGRMKSVERLYASRVRLALVLILLAVVSCESGGGREYIRDLSSTIRRSDRIVVTEHSSWLDAFDAESGKTRIPKEIVYRTRELSPAQQIMFVNTIESLDPATQTWVVGCVPEVHHTVHFFARGKSIGEMEICFACGQVMWNGTRATPPEAIYSGLASVVRAIGFEPKRDWAGLARLALKSP